MDIEGVEGPMERGHRASLPQGLLLRTLRDQSPFVKTSSSTVGINLCCKPEFSTPTLIRSSAG